MSQYKPYPAYKDSGVEWIGRVPEHWDVQRLKFSAACTNSNVDKKTYDDEVPTRLCNYTDVYYNEKITNALDFMQATATADEISKFSLRADDVLLTKDSETPDDIGIPALVEPSAEGVVCGYHLTVIRPEPHAYGGYLLRSLQGHPSAAQFYLGASGVTRYGLSKGAIDNLLTCCPPRPEQQVIAAFLDRETTRIDALIDKKQRLIELLKEKRQAVITQAVTKGLDANVPMKDSGVEWLGQVPAHWEIVRVGQAFRERSEKGTEGLPVLTVSIHHGVSDKEITQEESDRKLQRMDDKEKYKLVRAGDITYNMMRAWQGALGAVAVDGLVSPAYVVANPTRKLVSAYVEAILRTESGVQEMHRFSKGITDFRLRLYWDEFSSLRIPLPPVGEQRRIMETLYSLTSSAEELIGKAEKSIRLLQEHRSALITAAVTGQIDVRDVA